VTLQLALELVGLGLLTWVVLVFLVYTLAHKRARLRRLRRRQRVPRIVTQTRH
jgi:hypothetical protein